MTAATTSVPMAIDTILWPTDLSRTSLRAAPNVVSLAEKYGARVVLLYVAVDLCDYFPAYGDYPSQEHLREFQGWELERARTRLEALCGDELSACPNLDVRLVRGDAVREILKAAEKERADLLVLTGRGHGRGSGNEGGADERRTVGLGSVARAVLERAPIPVHLVAP